MKNDVTSTINPEHIHKTHITVGLDARLVDPGKLLQGLAELKPLALPGNATGYRLINHSIQPTTINTLAGPQPGLMVTCAWEFNDTSA